MRARKEEILSEAKSTMLVDQPCIVFFYYQTLTVKAFEDLRNIVRKISNSGVKVMKNTLTKQMFDAGLKADLESKCKGPMALAYSTADGIALSSELQSFFDKNKKKFPKVTVKYCLIGNQIHEGSMIKSLAEYKSIDGLKSTFLGLLTQPVQSLLGILNAPAANCIGVLEAKINKEQQV